MTETIKTARLQKMTPAAVSKAIAACWLELVPETRYNLSRVYEKTYSVVNLHHQGLVRPTAEVKDRLMDLYRVVRGEIERQRAG